MALLHAIRSPSKPLRHVVGTNVAVIVGVGGLPTWPELLMSFVQCLESNDHNALEGALDALYKVRPRPPPALVLARGARAVCVRVWGGGCDLPRPGRAPTWQRLKVGSSCGEAASVSACKGGLWGG